MPLGMSQGMGANVGPPLPANSDERVRRHVLRAQRIELALRDLRARPDAKQHAGRIDALRAELEGSREALRAAGVETPEAGLERVREIETKAAKPQQQQQQPTQRGTRGRT